MISKAQLAKNVAISTLKGGFGIVLPTFGVFYLIMFIYDFILSLLSPLTNYLLNFLQFSEFFVDVFALFLVFSLCFLCGLFIKTRLGKWSYMLYQGVLKKFKIFKLFNAIQEIYNQFFNSEDDSGSFSESVMAYPWGREMAGCSGLVSSKYLYKNVLHYAVFVPTCPNFTSGFLYHVVESDIDHLSVPVDEMMRTVIACGSGTKEMFGRHNIT
jgi:uncharacterized membrane protein